MIEATAKRAVSEGFSVILIKDLVSTYKENRVYEKQFLKLFDRYYGYVTKQALIVNKLELI